MDFARRIWRVLWIGVCLIMVASSVFASGTRPGNTTTLYGAPYYNGYQSGYPTLGAAIQALPALFYASWGLTPSECPNLNPIYTVTARPQTTLLMSPRQEVIAVAGNGSRAQQYPTLTTPERMTAVDVAATVALAMVAVGVVLPAAMRAQWLEIPSIALPVTSSWRRTIFQVEDG
jgi:hypothetical protein